MDFRDKNNELLICMAIEKSQEKKVNTKISAKKILQEYHVEKQCTPSSKDLHFFFSLTGTLDKPYYISKTLGIKLRNLTIQEIATMLETPSLYIPRINPYPYLFEDFHKQHLETFLRNEAIEIVDSSSSEEKLFCEKILYARQIIVIEIENIDKIVTLLDAYDTFIGEEIYDDDSEEDFKYLRIQDFLYGCISLITIFSNMTSLGKVPFGSFELSEPYFNKTLYEYSDLLCLSLPFYLNYLENDNIIDRFLSHSNIHLQYTLIYMAYTLLMPSDSKNNYLESIRSYITVLQSLVVKGETSITKQFIETIKYILIKEKQIITQEEIDFVSKELVYIYDLRSREEHGNFDTIKNTYHKIFKLYQNSNYDIFRKEEASISNHNLLSILSYRLNYFLQIVCNYYVKNSNILKVSKLSNKQAIHLPIDTDLKMNVEKVLKNFDLTLQEALLLFLEEIEEKKTLPFEVNPN